MARSKGSKKTKIIVVGAGLSGLAAASALENHSQKADVIVLEGRGRIGGRIYTKKDPSYGYVDAGASYVGPTQDRILRIAKKFAVKTFKVYQDGSTLFHSKGKTCSYDGVWPYWNPLSWLDCNNIMREIDHLAEMVPADAPWNAKRAEEWDNKTMMQFIREQCWTSAGREWGRMFVQSNITAEPEEVSLLFVLWYVKQAGGVMRLWEVPDASNERKFVGGAQQICEKLAKSLRGRIEINYVVKSIIQLENKVIVSSDRGETIEGDYVILAIPPHLVGHLTFDPPLPAMKRQLTQRMPMGACIKIQIWFESPFWRDMGLNGTSCIGEGDIAFCNTLDDVVPGTGKFALVCFVAADKARQLVQMDKDKRKAEVLKSISKIYNTPESKKVVGYEETCWMEEPLTGGCFTSFTPPGVITRYGRFLREPFGRIHFAGTETAIQWSGYMDGAVEAGERAAREVAAQIGYMVKKPELIYGLKEPPSKEVPPVELKFSLWERLAPSVPEFLCFSAAALIAGIASIRNRKRLL